MYVGNTPTNDTNISVCQTKHVSVKLLINKI